MSAEQVPANDSTKETTPPCGDGSECDMREQRGRPSFFAVVGRQSYVRRNHGTEAQSNMCSLWKQYLSAAKSARRKLDRNIALSEQERHHLESIKRQTWVADHVVAIQNILARSDLIENAWNPTRSLSPSWQPRPSIDDKQKTGDQEHFGLIWMAHRCIVSSQALSPYAEREARRKFSREQALAAPGDIGSVLEVVGSLLEEIVRVSSPAFSQFAVNLALFNFRTAGGGRARKISNWLRLSKAGALDDIGYLRPFEDGLPYVVHKLLQQCHSGSASVSVTVTGTRSLSRGLCSYTSQRYVPPTRFTATFPLILAGNQIARLPSGRQNALTYVDPKFQNLERDSASPIKYAFMGSFGFAEPSYTTWEKEHEYAGTRLSLGAYSLNPRYLSHLCQLAKMANRELPGYRRYGSVGLTHLDALRAVTQKHGHKLALIWATDMVRIATVLAEAAARKAGTMEQAGLVKFFTFVKHAIKRRHTKLMTIQRHTLDEPTSFEYIWVQESALWELAFLAVSCLSLAELFSALGRVSRRLQTSVTLNESIHEKVRVDVRIGRSCTFHRLYGPSGTAAATQLFETLGKLKYTVHGIESNPTTLNTFKPYFEFYQPGFLGVGEVAEFNSKIGGARGTQLWINLSDDLHAYLLDQKCVHDRAGAAVAALLCTHVKPLGIRGPVVLVIDFTKFAGDMSNPVLLPLLASLEDELRAYEWCKGVVFLRSTLKYNTGPLDRYQAGEILVRNTGNFAELPRQLAESLSQYFVKGAAYTEGKQWALNGHYISMMKKLYLVSEFIGGRRWELYSACWKG